MHPTDVSNKLMQDIAAYLADYGYDVNYRQEGLEGFLDIDLQGDDHRASVAVDNPFNGEMVVQIVHKDGYGTSDHAFSHYITPDDTPLSTQVEQIMAALDQAGYRLARAAEHPRPVVVDELAQRRALKAQEQARSR